MHSAKSGQSKESIPSEWQNRRPFFIDAHNGFPYTPFPVKNLMHLHSPFNPSVGHGDERDIGNPYYPQQKTTQDNRGP